MSEHTARDGHRVGRDHGPHSTAHRISIAAPAREVWRELADFAAWPDWNPLYVESGGTLAVGNTISFCVNIPGMTPHRGVATVIELEPGEMVRYRMVGLGGLSRATRFIEIVEDSPHSCSVVNGEAMGGLLAPVLFRLFAGRIRQGLQCMNEALEARVTHRLEEVSDRRPGS